MKDASEHGLKGSKSIPKLRMFVLWSAAILACLLFATTLTLAKWTFNPVDWIPELVEKGRVHFLPKWDLELYSCEGKQFARESCESVSGAFAFQNLRLPLDASPASRLASMAERSTHLEMRTNLGPQLADWIADRQSEEFLRPLLFLVRNGRCFEAEGAPFCSSKTEDFDAAQLVARYNQIALQVPISSDVRMGPQIIAPVLIEGSLLASFMSFESRVEASFWTDFTLTTCMAFLLAILALLFPWHAPTIALLGLALSRSLVTALSYGVENRGWEWLSNALGSSGYLAVSILFNSFILGLLLYLCFTIMKGTFRPSRFEVFYGLALVLLFVGVAYGYGHLGELPSATLFARDTVATLFGSIWVIYFLIHEWQSGSERSISRRSSLVSFLFLFFFVAYGAAAAQTALRQSPLPDLLPWQSLFFLPGVTIASFIHLRGQLRMRGSLS